VSEDSAHDDSADLGWLWIVAGVLVLIVFFRGAASHDQASASPDAATHTASSAPGAGGPLDAEYFQAAADANEAAAADAQSRAEDAAYSEYLRSEFERTDSGQEERLLWPSALNRFDCRDVATQRAAQSVLNADLSDPNHLDGDRDGIACEALP
jgi:hypothetical protein